MLQGVRTKCTAEMGKKRDSNLRRTNQINVCWYNLDKYMYGRPTWYR